MKIRKTIIIVVSLLLCSLDIAGETNNPSITINGENIDKSVNQITFDGDSILFHWSDGTTSNNDSQTILNLSSTNINDVKIFSLNGFQGGELKINGLTPSQNLCIYDLSGKMLLQTQTDGPQADININNFNTGIYLLKTNDSVIKFAKR